MKHFIRLFSVILLSQSLFVSCTETVDSYVDEEDIEQEVDVVTFAASISSLQSKATDASFDEGDDISVTAYMDDAIYAANVLYNYSSGLFEADAPVTLPEDGSSLSYIAIYPYEVMSDGVVEFSIESNQSGDDYTASDLMSSSLSATSQSSPSLTFNHLLSNIIVNVSSDSTLIDVAASIVSAQSVTFDIVNNSITSVGDNTNIEMGENGAYSYKAIVVPQTYNEGDIIATVTISDVDYSVECPYNLTLESGCQYTFDFVVEIIDDTVSEFEVTFADVQINDWGEGLSVDWSMSISSLDSAMADLYYALVAPGTSGSSAYHYDFGYPSLMIAFDNMTANVISTSGDGNSGYNWFSYFVTGEGLGIDYNYSRTSHIWTNYQNYITAVNKIILLASYYGDSSAETASYVAAAKAFRAMFYLDMARLYEPLANDYTDISAVEGLTVPYVSTYSESSESTSNPRLTRDEIFEKIFADLDDVEALYSVSNVQPLSANVPDLSVVYGLKARAYLWLGGFDSSYYADAATYARKAIDESGATIMSESQYCDVINGFNTPNNAWMLHMTQLSSTTSNLLNYVAWLSSEVTYGYGTLVAMGTHTSNYDRMSSTDFRKRLFLSGSATYSDYSDITLHTTANFSWAFAYSSLKFRPLQGNISTYSIGNITAIPLMRVEEMYLIEAEATAYSSAASAVSLLNSFMSYRDPSYSFASSDVDSIVDEIIFQKSVELWGEGLHLFDAKRLGLGIHLDYTGTNVASAMIFNIDGVAPWWNMPFPASAVSSNSALEGMNNPDPSEVYYNLF